MDSRIKVGAKCFLKAQGNKERSHRGKPIEEWIYEAEIVKVGRKYFTVSMGRYNEVKFNIEDLREATEYCSDWKFHFNKQDILDQMEVEAIESSIKSRFSGYGLNCSKLSLDKLRRMMAIINE